MGKEQSSKQVKDAPKANKQDVAGDLKPLRSLYMLPDMLLACFEATEGFLKTKFGPKMILAQQSPQVIVSMSKLIWNELSSKCDKLRANVSLDSCFMSDTLLDIMAQELVMSSKETRLTFLKKVDSQLERSHFLAANKATLSDFALFCFINNLKEVKDLTSVVRWYNLFEKTFPLAKKATPAGQQTKGKPESKAKSSGGTKNAAICPPLQHAEEGKVVTRFPPEPSGHLHIGHTKALFLNQYYANRYKGKMLLRFDDTNPSKEKEEYAEGIVEDLKTLNIDISKITHTSDYFDVLRDYAVKLIKQGDAYMDDTEVEVMRKERELGVENKNRSKTPDENMKLFDELLKGSAEGQKFCLRAKIDMQNVNKTLRDPVLFRYNATPHLRTKTKYKAYPTYDLACPIVDSLEGVTHAMRDMNYKDRVPLYNWFLDKLKLRKVNLHDFSRMNFVYTIMSKRNLKWLVEEGIATGWDDPRFPTIKGILRRGAQVDALYEYMLSQGASRKVCDIEWDKFWNLNKKKIDPVVPRYMGVDACSNSSIKISNFMEFSKGAPILTKTIPKHPKDTHGEKFGMTALTLCEEVLVETDDLLGDEDIVVGEEILLLQWGVIEITKAERSDSGFAVVEAIIKPNADVSKPKRKIHWLPKAKFLLKARIFEFDHLISKAVLEPNDDFKDFLNRDSWAETEVLVSPGVGLLKTNECLQLLRRGYYRVDKVRQGPDEEIHLFTIPDGKSKAMSTFSTNTSKMKHH